MEDKDEEKFVEFLTNKEPSLLDYIEAMELVDKRPDFKQWLLTEDTYFIENNLPPRENNLPRKEKK